MSTVDTSSWNPDADLNTAIEGIPLNSDAGIAQTWKVIAILMAAMKGDVNAVKAMISVMEGATASADGASGLVPKPLAGDQDKVLKGDGTWGTVEAAIDAALDAMLKNKIYPVGSTYFSLTDSRNPNVILGFGTWTAIEGKFLLGASSSYAADSTGGEASHTLTVDEMPSHRHSVAVNPGTGISSGFSYVSQGGYNANFVQFTGGGQSHNNLPPYIAGYLWRRTA